MPKNTLRILLVEDHPFQLIATQILLNNHGYYLLTPALSAAEAMLALENAIEPFDLLLCDQCLPDLTGLELIGLTSQRRLIDRAVILSGLSDDHLLELQQQAELLCLPLLGCLSKPLRVQALVELLLTSVEPASPQAL
ncbi:MAG: response regulator receiver [Pseudomonas sp.]|jgi:CheY-like chemotaxis protein|uniref:response regulator n=1 Tax=Pseudomonas sp. TaxID=306 RepID=UPI002628D40F|nr:response regulator [Pseudomonas sp.]MDB6051852.1 response regulator receiver [Pseudomonas sp.]